MAYSEVQKAIAVEIVRRNGGRIDSAVLSEISQKLNNPKITVTTVRRWAKSSSENKNIPEEKQENISSLSADLKSRATQALDDMYEEATRKYLAHALTDNIVLSTKGKDAIVAAATATDKMRLLRGLPTEIIAVLPDLIKTIQQKGYDPVQAIRMMYSQFSALPDVQMITTEHGAN